MSGPTRELVDAEARRRIAEELDATFFVEAAAGTGKTTALVRRILAVLESGAGRLDRLVSLTFTEKAAGEMKLRLRNEIEARRHDPGVPEEVRDRLDAALEQLEVARVGTIHGFCADLLREWPIEAGVDPRFEVVADDEASRLMESAFGDWFESCLRELPPGVRRVLRRRPKGAGVRGPRDWLQQAAWQLIEHRDSPAAWTRLPCDRDQAMDAVLRALREVASFADQADKPDDYLVRNLRDIGRIVGEVDLHESVHGARDADLLEAELRDIHRLYGWHWRGFTRFEGASRNEVIEARDEAKAALDELIDDLDADLAPLLRDELWDVVEAYEERKRAAGKLDFLDLMLQVRSLLREQPQVRAALQQQFGHFFVDEFQDTDPLQVEILMLLTAEAPAEPEVEAMRPRPGKLFFVGDPKQSIYRFRRADVSVYEGVKRRLVEAGAEVLYLTTSFRSLPGIQAAVNGAFAPCMAEGEGKQARYVPLDEFRAARPSQPAVVALPIPEPYSTYGKVTGVAVQDSLPGAVAAFLDWLLNESGWTVEDPDHGEVAVRPRDVCILFRRFRNFRQDVSREYVHALEARRVQHVLLGGSSLHEREEMLALRNLLAAIEWPDDTLRVYAALRGPLMALSDEALLHYSEAVGRLHPLRPATEGGPEHAEVVEALEVLARLHRQRNRRPLARTLTDLLDTLRAHAGIAIWPAGEQALANVLRLVERAHRFERGGAPSFRAFVERLEEEAERGEFGAGAGVEEGAEGVRLMSVHAAKGLEFPVVVLADPTCNATRKEPDHYADHEAGLWVQPLCGARPAELRMHAEEELARDAEESVRVSYVAATRARDLLVIPATGDEELEGWLAPLERALRPEPAARRQPREAPGCPAFGPDSVLRRPSKARAGPEDSVAPGRHTARAGNEVVWWDPAVLDLDRSPGTGLRQDRILRVDEGGRTARSAMESFDRWRAHRERTALLGAKPSRLVQVATELAHGEGAAARAPEAGATTPVQWHEVSGRDEDRPHGPRFGTYVHELMARAPLDAEAGELAATAGVLARQLGAPDEEREAGLRAVQQALDHPLLQRAAASEDLRRECPFLRAGPGGESLEGIVDLVFQEKGPDGERWVVVDFKTDRQIGAEARSAYEEQLRSYARAVQAAGASAVEAHLLVL